MSECVSDYKRFTLVFSGTIMGTTLDGFTAEPRRVSEIIVKQNFWASKAVVDGSYPALVWNHRFRVFTEAGSIGGFVEKFLNMSDWIAGVPYPLTIATSLGPHIAFGNCYLQNPSLSLPERLLMQRAGFVEVEFVGNTKPTLVSTT